MKKIILLAAMAGCAAAALSQAPAAPETTKRGPGNDPNEVVCVNEKQIGSRLSTRRVCRTRAAWEQHHRETRLAIDKAQTTRTTSGQ